MIRERETAWRLDWRRHLVFALLAAVFALSVAGLAFGLAAAVPVTPLPQEIAFALGLLVFALLGNRLLFGYGFLVSYLQAVHAGRTDPKQDQRAFMRSRAWPVHRAGELTRAGVALFWAERLDPDRYAFFGAFALLLLVTAVTALDPVANLLTGGFLEGAVWGAAVPVFFVFLLEALARWQIDELLAEQVIWADPSPAGERS